MIDLYFHCRNIIIRTECIIDNFVYIKAEHAHPGITYELVMGLVKKADMSVNMNESILRLQVHNCIIFLGNFNTQTHNVETVQ